MAGMYPFWLDFDENINDFLEFILSFSQIHLEIKFFSINKLFTNHDLLNR